MTFSYPAPVIHAAYDYEALRSQRIAGFLDAWTEMRQRAPDLPAYDTQSIENETFIIAINAAAKGDMWFIGRSNDLARAALLVDYAKSSDLDLHGLETKVPAHPDGLIRHPGETDEAFADRIIEARAGSSAAGPDDWWLTHARAADSRVRSIGLDYRGMGQLDIYILSTEHGGVPDQAMLDAISARLMQTGVRPRNVMPNVKSAIIDEVDIVADFWLFPDAPESRIHELSTAAVTRHNAEQALDRDLTHHYIKRLLDGPDVYKVVLEAPTTDLVADPSRAYSIRSITPRLAGRAR